MAELLEERGQSMAEQVACLDTLLRQEPVRKYSSQHPTAYQLNVPFMSMYLTYYA